MSRYVKAGWLYNELGDTNMDIYTDEVKEYIDSAPSIDIVCCSECKYRQQCRKAVEYIIHEPASVTIGYKSINFCSYGERENE